MIENQGNKIGPNLMPIPENHSLLKKFFSFLAHVDEFSSSFTLTLALYL